VRHEKVKNDFCLVRSFLEKNRRSVTIWLMSLYSFCAGTVDSFLRNFGLQFCRAKINLPSHEVANLQIGVQFCPCPTTCSVARVTTATIITTVTCTNFVGAVRECFFTSVLRHQSSYPLELVKLQQQKMILHLLVEYRVRRSFVIT
jgi:hypothetical protein